MVEELRRLETKWATKEKVKNLLNTEKRHSKKRRRLQVKRGLEKLNFVRYLLSAQQYLKLLVPDAAMFSPTAVNIGDGEAPDEVSSHGNFRGEPRCQLLDIQVP